MNRDMPSHWPESLRAKLAKYRRWRPYTTSSFAPHEVLYNWQIDHEGLIAALDPAFQLLTGAGNSRNTRAAYGIEAALANSMRDFEEIVFFIHHLFDEFAPESCKPDQPAPLPPNVLPLSK